MCVGGGVCVECVWEGGVKCVGMEGECGCVRGVWVSTVGRGGGREGVCVLY